MELEINENLKKLRLKLLTAERLDVSDIADRLTAAGFQCTGCAECCHSPSGDNCVMVFPAEIARIFKAYGLERGQICSPLKPYFVDDEGVLHSIEWELNRKESGTCIFNVEDKTCRIYSRRPWICRTYPFYLRFDENCGIPSLKVSYCPGVGRTMHKKDAYKLASLLKRRLVLEIVEEIGLLDNLNGHGDWKIFESSVSGTDISTRIIVHTSSGSTSLTLNECNIYSKV